MPLYSLVAWPPDPLARWLEREQARLGLAAYGPPHLNIRTPFEWDGPEAALMERVQATVYDLKPFDVRLKGWRQFPHTIFLELELDAALDSAHARSLAFDGVPVGPRDGAEYIPHLTLALGLLSWAEADTWQAIQTLAPPLPGWRVADLALTLDRQGTLDEVARFGLDASGSVQPT